MGERGGTAHSSQQSVENRLPSTGKLMAKTTNKFHAAMLQRKTARADCKSNEGGKQRDSQEERQREGKSGNRIRCARKLSSCMNFIISPSFSYEKQSNFLSSKGFGSRCACVCEYVCACVLHVCMCVCVCVLAIWQV